MGPALTVALLAFQAQIAPDPRLEQALSRLSEEAEVFLRVAPKVIGEETLKQRARLPPPRFRPRIGRAALEPPPARYQTREIVTEYGFSSFQEAPESLHEFRQVVSVDGRKVTAPEKARKRLVMGMRSADDKVKERLLRDFEKAGLHGAAADLAPMLLVFTRRQLPNYSFTVMGEDRIGAETALKIAYKQTGGDAGVTVFTDGGAAKYPLAGEIWVRPSDSLPLRLVLRIQSTEKEKPVTRVSFIDYQLGGHGVLLPASVEFKEYVRGELTVENNYRYASFKMFKVEAEIKFEVVDPPAGGVRP